LCRLATSTCAFAIVMALIIIHSNNGIFTFSNIFFGLTGVPVTIPLLLVCSPARYPAGRPCLRSLPASSSHRLRALCQVRSWTTVSPHSSSNTLFSFRFFPARPVVSQESLLSHRRKCCDRLLLGFIFSLLMPIKPRTQPIAPFATGNPCAVFLDYHHCGTVMPCCSRFFQALCQRLVREK
jgi:hypothetical protein